MPETIEEHWEKPVRTTIILLKIKQLWANSYTDCVIPVKLYENKWKYYIGIPDLNMQGELT